MCPEPAYGPNVYPGAGREDAGNGTACVESSRFAAPSLRYGPSGDTTPTVPKKFTMAVSKLPAMTDRRAHFLHALPVGTHVATELMPQHRRTLSQTPIPRARNRNSICRRQQK